VLDALHDARLFRLLIPRSYDGEEVEPATLFQVVETLAQGDASVAWCIGQGSGLSMSSAYVIPEVARTIIGDRRAVLASGPNNAKATMVVCDGGYRVTGEWGFASGSKHAAWRVATAPFARPVASRGSGLTVSRPICSPYCFRSRARP
jgi:indole-3-acetate monooxygenase